MNKYSRAQVKRRKKAFTLVESAACTVLVGVVMVAAFKTVSASKLSQSRTNDQARGYLAAQKLLDEIMLQEYSDPQGGSTFGVEAGEGTTNRVNWDDVDDYNGLSESPPKEKDGTAVASLTGWTQSVSVSWVGSGNLGLSVGSDQGLKRVVVTLSRANKTAAQLTAIKSVGLPTLQACCKTGVCEALDSATCTSNGGAPQGTGTVCWSTTCSVGRVLMVVDKVDSVTSQETARYNMLRSWNFTVALIEDGSSQAAFNTALASADVVYVPNGVSDSDLGTKLNAATIGVISEHEVMNQNLKIEGNYDERNGNVIKITNTSHYITSPFTAGTVNICSGTQRLTFWKSGALGGTQLASIQDTGSTYVGSLIVVDKNGVLTNLSLAAGRRVRLPWGKHGQIDFTTFSANGQLILYRSLIWGAGLEATATTPGVLKSVLTGLSNLL